MPEKYLFVYQDKEDGRWYIEKRRENDDWYCDHLTDFATKGMAVHWAGLYARHFDMGVEVA